MLTTNVVHTWSVGIVLRQDSQLDPFVPFKPLNLCFDAPLLQIAGMPLAACMSSMCKGTAWSKLEQPFDNCKLPYKLTYLAVCEEPSHIYHGGELFGQQLRLVYTF